MQKKEEYNKESKNSYLSFLVIALIWILTFLLIWIVNLAKKEEKPIETVIEEKVEEILEEKQPPLIIAPKPEIVEEFLTPNPYSRPGDALLEVNAIFVHYTANASTSAEQNRSYFENLGQTGETSASAHFIIGFEGEIIQCLPLSEIGYAVKGRNYDSISIECCYVDSSGKFTEATYQSLIELVAYLMGEYDLTTEQILRHYDEGGKLCPKYYVENSGRWNIFQKAVESYRKRVGTEVDREDEEIHDGTVDTHDEEK